MSSLAPVPARRPALSETRVAVTLGGIPLWGQERGNIQVFSALREAGVRSLFLTHDEYGHLHIQPALDALGHEWTPTYYPGRWNRGMGLRWLVGRAHEAFRSNREFVRAVRAYGATHIHTMNEQYATDLMPSMRLLGLPIVYRVGDQPRRHRALFRFVWRRVLGPAVDQFVAVSGFIRDELVSVGVPREKIRVIYNYPPDRPALETTDLPGDLAASYGGRTVVYVGQITESKGVGHLVEAALELCSERDGVRFLLAGDHSWQNPFAEGLIDRVRERGLGDRIQFLGYVKDVKRLLALADVHAAPSVCDEALGNVVLEAKQAGVPSVVFPSGGLPELAHQPGVDTVVCREPSTKSLAEGLRHYLDLEPAGLREAGGAARSSLEALGITRGAFLRAWADVYATL